MSHNLVVILADLAIFLAIIFLPVLWIIFTDRFRQNPSPQQYALLFVVVAIVGALLLVPAVSIIAAVALLALGVAWLSAQRALSGLAYTRTLLPGRLFPGDEAELLVRFDNRKLLPLAWLSITDPIHFSARGSIDLGDFLGFSGGIEVLPSLEHALINHAAVAPFQELVRVYRVQARQRGVYTLGPAQVESGDPFGLFHRTAALGGRLEIMVYPRLFAPDEIGLPFREALGEHRTRAALVEDPTLIAGSREYRPGDPLRHMHWKATARTAELQVRVTDPSTTAQLMVVLNLNTFQHVWQGVDAERMEAAINVAASLAVWALDRDYAVGLRSNGIVGGAETTPRLAPSASPRQAGQLLEHLARLTFSGRFTPEQVLLDEAGRLGARGSIVFVTPTLTPALIDVLTSRRLRERVSVVYCGRFAAPVVRGVPIYLAAPPAEAERAVS